MGRGLHSERHSGPSNLNQTLTVVTVLPRQCSRHRHHSLVTAGTDRFRETLAGYSVTRAGASRRGASRSRALRESFPTVLLRGRPPTTNPSRLGHTKRQRHVRHNISSSGKRATRNVATYATCGAIAALRANQSEDAHSIICIRRIRSPRAREPCVRKMDATARSVVTPRECVRILAPSHFHPRETKTERPRA